MPRSSIKSSALISAQNALRGSRDPWSALSVVRAQVPSTDIQALARWIPNFRSRSGAIIARRFPNKLEQVRGRSPLLPTSLTRELAWATEQLVEDAPRIVRFLSLKAEFERELCGGQAGAALRTLDDLERDLGFSFWSVEARINALQIQNGLEAQKAFLATMRKVLPGNDVTSFVAHHVSRRCEPSTLPLRFARAFAQMTAQWNDTTGLDRYLNYRIAGVAPTTAREFANLLHHETASTGIDQYETLLCLARTASTGGDTEIAAAFEGPVLRLAPLTQDERLAKIVAVRGGDAGFPFLGFVNDDATDHALAGDIEQAREAVSACVAARPNDPRIWLLKALLAEAVGEALPQGPSLADQCCYELQAVIGEGDEGEQAYIQLLRLSLTLQALSFSPSTLLFTFQALTSHRGAVRPMEQMSFVERPGTRADDVALLPEALRPAFLKAASTALGDVAAVARGYVLAGLPYNGLATLGPDEVFRASVEALLVRHDERAALALLLPSVEVAGEERSRWAIRHAAMCMASLGDFLALARFIVRHATKRPGLLRSLPVAECVAGLTDGDRTVLKRELTLPILLHFAFQQDDGASADARAFAYEDFLIANGMGRPSEISQSGSGFDTALLVFYLRNLCIPEIMQVSSEFQSTRELQEERIAVLRFLVELDPENAKGYEDELRETTRTLLVHSGVRHVGQTKIFVDIPALRRWAERNHKEDYARLLTHLQVGMGIENELIASAYQRAAQAKQPGAGMLEVPKHEATDLLVKMVISLLSEFLANPDHGLDCYLSMRIRHGTLSGQLRTPLEVENLITQRRAASEEYALNEHWVSALDQHRVPSSPVVDRLARFSSEYDELIAEMSSELIQIRSAEKPQGLFDIRIPVKHLFFISGRLTPDVSFEDFLDLCIELFWGFVDLCLRDVRGVCEERLKPRVTEMFTSLEADVAPLAGAARHDLERAIRSARTGAHQALDIVADWFRLPAPQEEPVFPIEAMIDVGLQCVTTIYPDFRPDLHQSVPSLPPFRGALALFSDIFFIVFDNIRRHSGSSTPRVDITIDDLFTSRLRVRIASDLGMDVDVVGIESKLREIRDRIATDDYRSAVTSEGGTGLIKLHRILCGRSSLDGRFEFGIEEGRFVVDLELSARTVSS